MPGVTVPRAARRYDQDAGRRSGPAVL